MSPTRARKRIRDLARQNRFVITEHCALRLLQRSISERDVRAVLTAASGCRSQAGGRWRLEGEDGDNEMLFLIVDLQKSVVVVTAFRGDEDEDDEG